MAAVVEHHIALLDAAIEAHDGVHFKTVGDAEQAAFSTSPRAVAAALDGQRALLVENWGAVGSLIIRMALHAGEAAPDEGGDYRAAPLNRLSRLFSTDYCGQILLSQAVQQLPLATRVRLPDQDDEAGRPGTVIDLNQAASTDGPPGRAFVDSEGDLGRLLVIPRRLALQRQGSGQTAEAVRSGKVIAPPLVGRQQDPLEGSERNPLAHDVDDRRLRFTFPSHVAPLCCREPAPEGPRRPWSIGWVADTP